MVTRPTIVIIDDCEITLNILSHAIEKFLDADVHVFSSTITALAYIGITSSEYINVLICDWNMPRKNGGQLISSCSGKLDSTYKLMVTADVSREVVASAKEAGFDDVLAKPINVDALIERLKSHGFNIIS